MPPQDSAADHRRAEDLARTYAKYADPTYNSRWALDNPGNAAIVAERAVALDRLVASWGGAHRAIRLLDLGCGSASDLPGSLGHVARVGVDLLLERLVGLVGRGAELPVVCADGARLPFVAGSFDVVVMSTVLSSVPDAEVRARIASESDRVLRPGGAVLWYDMRLPSPRNRSVSPLTRGRVERLFEGYAATWLSVTLLPPLARRLGSHARRWYGPLRALPPLRSHLAGILVKP